MKLIKKLLLKLGYFVHNRYFIPIGTNLKLDFQDRLKGEVNCIFDVGANIGQTYKSYRDLWPGSYIYSFEPVESTFEMLKSNVGGDGKVCIEKLAFGAKEESKEIAVFDGALSVLNTINPIEMNKCSEAKLVNINISTIDGYCKSKNIINIDLLKIDVEGWEVEVLMGATSMLKQKAIKAILLECGFQSVNKRNTNFSDLVLFLENYDYYFYSLYDTDAHDFLRGNHLSNAMFVSKSVFEI